MKRIISLVLLLSLCLSLFACAKTDNKGTDGTSSDGTDATVNNGGSDPIGDGINVDSDSEMSLFFSYLSKTLDQDNATVSVDLADDDASVGDISLLVDLKGLTFIVEYTEYYGLMDHKKSNVKIAYKDGVGYEIEQNEVGKLHGTASKVETDDGALSVFGMIVSFFGEEEKDFTKLISAVSRLVLGGEMASEANITKILGHISKKLSDDDWTDEMLALKVSEDGNKTTYEMKLNVYAISKDIVELLKADMSEADYNEALSEIEESKEMYGNIGPSGTFVFTDGLLTEATVTVTSAGMSASVGSSNVEISYHSSTVNVLFTDYGKTVVPIDELIKALDESHNGHTECVKCGDNVYFSCYCYSCASELLCRNLCGNARTEDNVYCDDCYKPCTKCGGAQQEYNGYCYDCYHRTYCNEDCGKPATNFAEYSSYGYCDDCFKPCKECGEHNSSDTSDYCYECRNELFCSECGVNPITVQFDYEGYCDDCFTPCPDCGEKGNERYKGYCYDCFHKVYCSDCNENKITHQEEYSGYCDDCFTPCTRCGEHNYDEDSELCYDCRRETLCNDCGKNPITHTASDEYGYCDQCYSICSECGEELRSTVNGICYECYYNKYCHQCGKNEITHGSGTEHKTCDNCYS